MKTFIIAAVTADGFIGKDPKHSAFWTSKEDKARFVRLTKEAGAIVMGSTTFATLPRPLKERRNIIYTRDTTKHTADPKYQSTEESRVETTQEAPRELLTRLESEGIANLAICGGTSIYTLFLKAHAVDKIYLTVEPVIFGRGMSLFNEELQIHLKLVAAEGTASGSLLLEYDVDYHGSASSIS